MEQKESAVTRIRWAHGPRERELGGVNSGNGIKQHVKNELSIRVSV